MKPLIFTDLDGTLLNHEDYRWEGAKEALEVIRKRAIPLVMTTSKTRLEVAALQKDLGICEPLIVENGGGIFYPDGYRGLELSRLPLKEGWRVQVLGEPYEVIRAFCLRHREAFGLKGFGDMEVREIMEATGLDEASARMAKAREFTEPFLMSAPEKREQLEILAEAAGLKLTKGGRFYHLIGAGQDKGRAVEETTTRFEMAWEMAPETIALGDSPNDFPMLKAVRHPVLIPHPDGSFEALSLPGLQKAPYPGSKGWGISVLEVLDALG